MKKVTKTVQFIILFVCLYACSGTEKGNNPNYTEHYNQILDIVEPLQENGKQLFGLVGEVSRPHIDNNEWPLTPSEVELLFEELDKFDSINKTMINNLKNIETFRPNYLQKGALTWAIEADSLFLKQFKPMIAVLTGPKMNDAHYDSILTIGQYFVKGLKESNEKFVPLQEQFASDFNIE